MQVTPLSSEAAAKTGFTHVARFRVSDGDLSTVSSTALNVFPTPVGSFVGPCALYVKTAYATMTSPAVDIGIGNTATSSDTLMDGSSLGTVGSVIGAGTNGAERRAVTAASQFLTIRQQGTTASATAGEFYLYFRMVDGAKLTDDPATHP